MRIARKHLPGSALVGAVLLSASAALAQAADERFPFLAMAAPAAAIDTPAPPAEALVAARVPLPRPAPHRAKPRASGVAAVPAPAARADEPPLAPARIAYAAQPADAVFPLSWLLRGPAPEAAPAAAAEPDPPRPPAVIPDRAGLPLLEPRYHVRRVPIAPSDLVVLIENKAIAHGVPLELAHAVIRIESSYDPRLTGRGGALGLMQIKHATARSLGFTGSAQDLYDPATNLEWGMRYLGQAYKLARGDMCGTIMKYQGGHRTMHMTPLSTAYCGRARSLIASVR